MLITRLLLVLEVLGCETNLQEIMGWEYFGVVRFDRVLASFLSGGYNLHRFSDALGLVTFVFFIKHFVFLVSVQVAPIST